MNARLRHGVAGSGFRSAGTAATAALVVFILAPSLLTAQEAAKQPAPAPEGVANYIAGIEALEAADFPRAVQTLTRALDAEGDNGNYLRARGVAHTLAESFPAAIADLQRAMRFYPADREARLWLGAAYRMSNETAKGAENFVHGGEIPVDYASKIYNEMAGTYWSSRYRGDYLDRETHRNIPVDKPVKTLFPEVARAYAQRNKASGAQAAAVLSARMTAAVQRGDWAAAIQDVVTLRRSSPDDPTLRAYWATALLRVGNVLHAREEFTRALSVLPLWADGYAGRAQAQAVLGDAERAKSDIDVAASLGFNSIDALRAQVTRALEQRSPPDAADRFDKALRAGAAPAALIDDATALLRLTNARRLRYDQAYQDRVRVLSVAMRDEAKGADRPEALARFLYTHYVVPFVWNGPRAGGEQLRPQSTGERTAELNRAIALADAALKLDDRHANAMATKGWILYTLGRSADAEALADRGLPIAPQNVRLLNLKASILSDTASALAAQAAALRTGHTETHTERRSDGVYRVTTTTPPTAAELAQASALDARAAQLRRQAAALFDEQRRVESDVIPALFKRADDALAANDLAAARAALEQVSSLHPDRAELCARLSEVCKRQGDQRSHQVYALLAEPMRHTTAAEPLKAAWDAVTRTAWTLADQSLARAAEIDPGDVRITAYRSVMVTQRTPADPDAARRHRLAVIALEEARARMMGTTFAGDRPSLELIGLPEVALTLTTRLDLGRAYASEGANDKAVDVLAANISLEKRFSRDTLVRTVPAAMLPDPTADPNTIPESPTFGSLLAWSRLETGRALLALNRPAEARDQFAAVRAYEANWPATATDRKTLYVVDAWARLGQAEAAFGAKDYERAFTLLMSGEGWPWNLPEDLTQRKKQLTDRVLAARAAADAQEQGNANQPRPIDLQAQMRVELQRLQRQREITIARINKPGASDAVKSQLQAVLQQLDRSIELMKAVIEQEGEPPTDPDRPREPARPR